MPRGGHNAKPTELRLLQGTARPDRMKPGEPTPDVLANLVPPGSLDAYGKQCWNRNAPVLARMGLLTEVDVDQFTAYCDTYSQWRHAVIVQRKLSPDDDGYRRVAVTVENARTQMRLMAGEFGMSPSSRSRLSVGKAAEEADPMERLLTKGRAG